MSYVMFGYFPKYGGWPMTVIDVCKRFHAKYNRYPNFIRMKEKTMNALFDENEKAFNDPESEEHAVTDTNGNLLMLIHSDDEDSFEEFYEEEEVNEFVESIESSYENEDIESIIEDDFEDDECIRPTYFGPNDDCTVSFATNKFELKFLEGEELPDDYFIVQFGDGPDDGGEDFEEETEEVPLEIKSVA